MSTKSREPEKTKKQENQKTLPTVSVLLFSSRKIFHEGWVENPLKRIFTRVEKKNFDATRRKKEER
jgi:hypothetical protein